MPSILDVLYVALFAVAVPLWDYLVFWPAFHRRAQAEPERARRRLWQQGIVLAWLLVAAGSVLWTSQARPWTSLGFALPAGWRLFAAIGLLLLLATYHVLAAATLARSVEARASLRQQIGELGAMMPHTRPEFLWFCGVSLTAGFCEEFLFRGYLVWVFSAWLGWWGAAALSLTIFALAHLYQGWSGALRTAMVGALYTLAVAALGSLWPAIALHALVDLGSGAMAWLALRQEVRSNG